MTLYASDKAQSILEKLGDELRFVLITSSAKVRHMQDCPADAVLNEALGVSIHVAASDAVKCDRCWHRCEDVGEDKEHPLLCLRCVGNISGQEEPRHFA